jgi:hypothetical protein
VESEKRRASRERPPDLFRVQRIQIYEIQIYETEI